MSDYNTELDSVKDERKTSERKKKDCPHCGGVVLEPRSSEKWNCAHCARQFDWDDLAWE